MYTAGIVAEFNPFHKGHEYIISRARRQGASHIVCVMSGSAVQRGELAITDKHTRAAAAIRGGADLVVELPAPYSCSVAEVFARSSVHILVQLGIDALAFGSEYDSEPLLRKAAGISLRTADEPLVSALVSDGQSYPSAVFKAAETLAGREVASVLSSPNSTLATEYIKALLAHDKDIALMPIKRIGSPHDSTLQSSFPSGSLLRSRILSGEMTPDFTHVPPTAAEHVIYYSLVTADKQRLMQLPELGEPLADRILKLTADPPPTLGEFLLAIKNKSCTLARLRRSALHLALGVEAADILPDPPYIRILALNTRGTEILKNASPAVPISTSLRTLEDSSERAARISSIENRAVRLMQLCTGRFDNEYTRKIIPTDITRA